MMRKFTTTDDIDVWINDAQVVAVYGETNSVVKVVCSVHQHERAFTLQVKGSVRDVALALNGHFDE